jgi:hypothetical protein
MMSSCRYQYTLAHILLLTIVSGYILAIFLKPPGHYFGNRMFSLGINTYYRAKFIDMVEGRAYKPFVYRTLLPSTVRLLSSVTPEGFQRGLSNFVEKHDFTAEAFDKLEWETSAAYSYLLACIFMWLSYIGFAHFSSKLIIQTCNIQETFVSQSGLAILALVGLPPFFKYGSFVYDPTQLLLFAALLYFLAKGSLKPFLILFPFACVNKETAVVLIPVGWFVWRDIYSRGKRIVLLAGMLFIYVVIKGAISHAFQSNPGSFVEFHLLDHNFRLISRGWGFTALFLWLSLLVLLTYKWRQKAYFLRASFLCILSPLVGLALFMGYLDEWRGYYEAYPVALGLIVDSVFRIKSALEKNTENPLAEGL